MESRDRRWRHGLSGHKLYNVWQGIKTRCRNSKSNRYKYYGGRGIGICEEWQDFSSFYQWATIHGYKEGLTLDRIDRNKGYSPDNCQWVDYEEQNSHKSGQKRILYEGKEYPLKEAAKKAKVPLSTIYQRLRRGMNHTDIIDLPPQTINSSRRTS